MRDYTPLIIAPFRRELGALPPSSVLPLPPPPTRPGQPRARARNFFHLAREKRRSAGRLATTGEIKRVFPMAQKTLPLCGLFLPQGASGQAGVSKSFV